MQEDVVPFGVATSFPSASHGDVALALAGEFAVLDLEAVDAAVDLLAERIGCLTGLAPDAQLLSVCEGLHGALEVAAPRHLLQYDDLWHHEVALGGAGHPLAVAVVAVEAARRAGAQLGVVASGRSVYVGHPGLRGPLLADPGRGFRIVDGHRLGDGGLGWRCPHTTAGLLLGEVLDRARDTGMLPIALRAAELFCLLPVDRTERSRLRVQLARVRASLN